MPWVQIPPRSTLFSLDKRVVLGVVLLCIYFALTHAYLSHSLIPLPPSLSLTLPSSAGQDFTGVSETFTFTPSFSGRPPPFTLVINITDDSLVEETESFSVRLSLVGELDREVGNVVVVNSETDVFIEDNDSEF